MPFTQLFPILSTGNLRRLLDFYVAAADATVTYVFPADAEPGYAALDLAGSHLGIGLDPAAVGPGAPQRTALWLVTDDCDAAVARLVSAGASVVEPPSDRPWGERVAVVTDPDGNRLHIGQRTATG